MIFGIRGFFSDFSGVFSGLTSFFGLFSIFLASEASWYCFDGVSARLGVGFAFLPFLGVTEKSDDEDDEELEDDDEEDDDEDKVLFLLLVLVTSSANSFVALIISSAML